MADTYLTQSQLEDIFQSLTSTILGTSDPSAVRISWPTGGAPAWSISDDVCFLRITPSDNPYTRQFHRDYASADDASLTLNLTYTAGVRVYWDFYGPDAGNHADVVRAGLFLDSSQTTLAQNNLFLVTDVAMPIRTPELFNGQWWNRASFYADFNELVIRQSMIPTIATADVIVEPDVKIQEG